MRVLLRYYPIQCVEDQFLSMRLNEVRRSLGLNEGTLKREAVTRVDVAKNNALKAEKAAIDAEREASQAVGALNEVGWLVDQFST